MDFYSLSCEEQHHFELSYKLKMNILSKSPFSYF